YVAQESKITFCQRSIRRRPPSAVGEGVSTARLPLRSAMPISETDIVVDDPTAPADNSPAAATTRTVEVVVYLLLLALAILLGFDNWRSGMGWAKDGPQTGYVPFYLCVILGGASLYGLGVALLKRRVGDDTFVTRDQLR